MKSRKVSLENFWSRIEPKAKTREAKKEELDGLVEHDNKRPRIDKPPKPDPSILADAELQALIRQCQAVSNNHPTKLARKKDCDALRKIMFHTHFFLQLPLKVLRPGTMQDFSKGSATPGVKFQQLLDKCVTLLRNHTQPSREQATCQKREHYFSRILFI